MADVDLVRPASWVPVPQPMSDTFLPAEVRTLRRGCWVDEMLRGC